MKSEARSSRPRTIRWIIVPGGFGSRGVEGKLDAIRYCRENKIPYLGLCYGMQLAMVEFASECAENEGGKHHRDRPGTKFPMIDIFPEQKKLMAEKNYGGTMRLGAYPAVLNKRHDGGKGLWETKIQERHSHRFEVNPAFIKRIEKAGIVFSGQSPDRRLMEVMELSRETYIRFLLARNFIPNLLRVRFAPIHCLGNL